MGGMRILNFIWLSWLCVGAPPVTVSQTPGAHRAKIMGETGFVSSLSMLIRKQIGMEVPDIPEEAITLVKNPKAEWTDRTINLFERLLRPSQVRTDDGQARFLGTLLWWIMDHAETELHTSEPVSRKLIEDMFNYAPARDIPYITLYLESIRPITVGPIDLLDTCKVPPPLKTACISMTPSAGIFYMTLLGCV